MRYEKLPIVRARPQKLTGDGGPLARDLAGAIDGDVRFDAGSRAIYSTDASNYRHVPLGVVVHLDADARTARVQPGLILDSLPVSGA